MRQAAAIITFLIVLQSCTADDMVTITKYFIERPGDGTLPERVEKEQLPLNTDQLVLRFAKGVRVYKIEGVEKLTQVQRLLIGYGLSDFSFLDKLVNVEILILEDMRAPIDLAFIKKMPKLKILFMSKVILAKEEMNLINNKELAFLALKNMSSELRGNRFFEIKIDKIPESLECVDLSISARIVKNETLLGSLQTVPIVIISNIIGEAPILASEQFLKNHPNIKIENNSEAILPEKYHRKQIYGLFKGLDQDY